MGVEAIITLAVIIMALILFATEWVSVDFVAILIIVALVLTGVVSPEEGVSGFSNPATITVALMFVLSASMLKTGALQYAAHQLSGLFQKNFSLGLLLLMLLIAFVSAFVNNTPVVAVFIPVVIQIAHSADVSPSKMLIPLSFASILGGTSTLIGTSTNILVSGILESEGLEGIGMFQMTPFALILLGVGFVYLLFFGAKLLPDRKLDSGTSFGVMPYISEIEILEKNEAAGQMIMNTGLVKELRMDILEVRRGKQVFNLPPGDFVLQPSDQLKVRCDASKLKQLKDKVKVSEAAHVTIGKQDLRGKASSIVELVIASNSPVEGKTLREVDFRRRFRAIPLAIRHRQEVLEEGLYDTPLKSGDVVLADVKAHFVRELKRMENEQESPFIVLSEDSVIDFNLPKFLWVLMVTLGVVFVASMQWLHIMVAALTGVVLLLMGRVISMNEFYKAINWKVVFLLAGSLTLGKALQNSGLDHLISLFFVDKLGSFGPVVVISGLYLCTSFLTEVMSNNATAAIMAPIAIAVAAAMGLPYMPFVLTVTFAASATFMTPIGYQTNTMVYSAGAYKFRDFLKVGTLMNILFWLLATIFIPILYGLV